jgi:hypothetical protein
MADVPAPAPVPRPPTPLDRTAVERIIARAAELQAASAEPAEALTEAQVLEIAREVGLAPEHVRRSIAEERTRVALEPESGLAARVAGPGRAVAARVVPGRAAEVLVGLIRAIEEEECFRVVRRLPDRVLFEQRNDLVGALRRGLGVGGRPALRAASELALTVVPVDEGRVLVRLEADVSQGRRQRLAAGGATAIAGLFTGGAVLVAGAVAHAIPEATIPLALLPSVAGSGAGWALARAHRNVVARAQTALEHLLDRLERGELRALPRPAPTLRDVIDTVRRSIG